MSSTVRLFISHSSKDGSIARQLVELIRHALPLGPTEIRCTSINGYRLRAGSSTDEKLRSEAVTADAFIGLISANSIASTFVLFELGARWGSQRPFIPLLVPGFGASNLDGPLKQIHALDCGERAHLHQMIRELCTQLGVQSHPVDSYSDYIDKLARGEVQSSAESIEIETGSSQLTSESPGSGEYHDLIASLKGFERDQARMSELYRSEELLPNDMKLFQVQGLLNLFGTDTNKMQVLKWIANRTQKLNRSETTAVIEMFSTDSNRFLASSFLRDARKG